MALEDHVSYCPKCIMVWYYKPDIKDEDKPHICGYKGCDGVRVHTKILAEEDVYIENISKDHEFLAAMNELRSKDLVAFKEKMAEYKIIYEKTHKPLPRDNKIVYKQPAQSTQPQITCPYCKSTNTKKISSASRAGSILGFGIFSKKIGKEWHCNNCNSDF